MCYGKAKPSWFGVHRDNGSVVQGIIEPIEVNRNDTTQQNDTPQQRGGFFTIAAWQRADDLAVKVSQVTKSSPPFERFGLTAQMQRAAVSVAANLASARVTEEIAEAFPHSADPLFCATEATGFTDWHLLESLAESALLAADQPKRYRMNPRTVKAFTQVSSQTDKTDRKDAFGPIRRLGASQRRAT